MATICSGPARRVRRPAFTLVELLLVSGCTVSILTAGTTMVLAVSYVSSNSQVDQSASIQGHSVMRRLARMIRGARLIGYWSADKFILWNRDSNSDDQAQLSETSLVWYDSATKELKWTEPFDSSTPPAVVAASDRVVAFAELMSPGYPNSLKAGSDASTVVLAEGAPEFLVDSNATGDRASLLDLKLSLTPGGKDVAYCTSASPRAPAEYLVDPTKNTNDGIATYRKRRVNARTWHVPGVTAGD